MVDPLTKISPVSSVSGVSDLPPSSSTQTTERFILNSDAFDPLNGVNIDQWNLSFADKLEIQFARIQFGLSYQVMNAMSTLQGREASSLNLFTSANTELLKTIVSQFPTTSGTVPSFPSNATGNTSDATLTTTQIAQEALTAIKDFFSPENTAKRILEVATSFYRFQETAEVQADTEATRQAFADTIGGAIDEGFRQARRHLWQLPNDIQNGVDLTQSRVTDGLTRFVQGGIPSEKTDSGSTMTKIAAFHQEATQIFSQIRKVFAPSDYNAQGGIQPISMATFNKVG
jgi:hypothetical protein